MLFGSAQTRSGAAPAGVAGVASASRTDIVVRTIQYPVAGGSSPLFLPLRQVFLQSGCAKIDG
ncbi:MAG: hypothetical protein ABUS79_16555, partial [Pseudomonadota bacterium]